MSEWDAISSTITDRMDALRKFLRSLQVKNDIVRESRFGQVKFLQVAIIQGLDGKLDYEIHLGWFY